MVTRYFDIPPGAEALAYGFNQFLDERKRLDEINHQKNLAKKAKRKKNLIMGLSAAGAAVAAPFVAPALGLAGAAGTAGFGAAEGAAAGAAGLGVAAVPATAATAGILGTGGVVGLGGMLTAGAIGAGVGSAFGEGDIAGGFSALASPFVQQQQRRMRSDERASDRAANLSDSITLDKVRTKGNIEQIQYEQDYKKYGMPRAEWDATAQAAGDYASTIGMGPMAGEDLNLDPAMAAPAMGPMGGTSPGPSEVPGMDYQWTRQNYAALSKLERQRLDTVDNPAWRTSATPERLASETAALQRARAQIKPSLVPSQPKPMYVNEAGQAVPMQLGENRGKDGTYVFDGKDIKHIQKQSKPEAIQYYSLTPPEQEAHLLRALPDGGLQRVRDAKGIIKVKQNGEVDVEWPTGGKGSETDAVFDQADYLAMDKQFAIETEEGTTHLTPAEAYGKWKELQRINDVAKTVDVDLKQAYSQIGQGKLDVQGVTELGVKLATVLGTDASKWPLDVRMKFNALGADVRGSAPQPPSPQAEDFSDTSLSAEIEQARAEANAALAEKADKDKSATDKKAAAERERKARAELRRLESEKFVRERMKQSIRPDYFGK